MAAPLNKPRALRPGDRIGVITPASAPKNPDVIEPGIAALRAMGYDVVLAPNARKKLGFLAGTDQERAADLMQFFEDPTIHGIVSMRGGYGTSRILPLLDVERLRKHPKLFCGYSDTTCLSLFFQYQCGFTSFYGPMVTSEFAKPATPFILDSFTRAIASSKPYGELGKPEGWNLGDTLVPGKARGRLSGGCLTLVEMLIGTRWQPSFRDSIFFFEDVDVEPYAMDRMITHILQSGILDGVKGIAIGECADCEHIDGRSSYSNCQSLREVLTERFSPLGVPVLYGVPFGHGKEKATIPFGVEGELDADAKTLTITEAALSA